MSQARNLEGVFAVHKPSGISSADVLRDLQHHFNPSKFFQPWLHAERERRQRESHNQRRRRRDKRVQVKLGHGGTLDPIATGVLITGVGKGTKQLNNFLACTKTYEAVVLFGVATDSYDRVGKVVSRAPYGHVTKEKVEAALQGFRGKIMQRPSIFSALKVQGKKLYEYAREGKEPPVEIAERPVEVSNLEIVEWYEPGTHEWKWPTEEAGPTEKDVAKKMIAEEKDFIDKEQRHEQDAKNLKRKTPPPADEQPHEFNPDQEDLSSKRQKTEPSNAQSEMAPESTTTAAAAAAAAAAAEQPLSKPIPDSKEPHLNPDSSHPPPPAVKLTMTVSSGFYVRSLAHDLGLALDSNAIMTSLVRTRQGDFELSPDKTLEYQDLKAGEEVWGPKVQKFLDEWCEKMENS
ncbi:pseudouridine synthase pus4 [Emydomyces testavorans]|uniref:tRNA pseudouridine(55) synthase n=1 Tax=Emydomyces testavorans TaxID=2070801 RepID=A0AAF0DP94_9EURO|nr:pseudouridine synthase pus4 [Emydomyces testavorans]